VVVGCTTSSWSTTSPCQLQIHFPGVLRLTSAPSRDSDAVLKTITSPRAPDTLPFGGYALRSYAIQTAHLGLASAGPTPPCAASASVTSSRAPRALPAAHQVASMGGWASKRERRGTDSHASSPATSLPSLGPRGATQRVYAVRSRSPDKRSGPCIPHASACFLSSPPLDSLTPWSSQLGGVLPSHIRPVLASPLAETAWSSSASQAGPVRATTSFQDARTPPAGGYAARVRTCTQLLPLAQVPLLQQLLVVPARMRRRRITSVCTRRAG